MIDLHCHILHGVDDGPESVDESLAMARRAAEDGIHTVVATPHTLNGIYMSPIDEVIERVATLEKDILQNHIELELYAGADVHLCPHLLNLIQKRDAGTINAGMKYLLLESSPPRRSIEE